MANGEKRAANDNLKAWYRRISDHWLGSKLWIILLIYAAIAIGTATQNILISGKPDKNGGLTMKYNNYLIFKYSFFNLVHNKDMYKIQPGQAKDYYKYSPSFALLFGALSCLPDIIGLNIWNLLNTLVLFFSITFIINRDNNRKIMILLFILIELITSTQNSQSNALVAGLLIFSFGLLEKKKFLTATLFIVLTVYIKIFGIIAIFLFAMYPEKWKLLKYTVIWSLLFFFLPLIVVGWNQFIFLYNSWFNLLMTDHSISTGLSVTGFIQAFIPSMTINNFLILCIGFLLFLLPLVQIRQYHHYFFRLLFLCSLLIWIVIFNHKAESPTFIIAMTGAGLWFFTQKTTTVNLVLLIIAFVLTSLSSTDIIPGSIRDDYIVPYCLKVIPCILIWLKITIDLLRRKDFTVFEKV